MFVGFFFVLFGCRMFLFHIYLYLFLFTIYKALCVCSIKSGYVSFACMYSKKWLFAYIYILEKTQPSAISILFYQLLMNLQFN